MRAGALETSRSVSVRSLREADLEAADRVFRLAFGTMLGLPEPLRFGEGAQLVRTRWLKDPDSAFVAELDGQLVGSNFATRWGSFGSFGPLTVDPEHWDRGVGRRLMEPVLARLEAPGITHIGIFTAAHSPKHTALYQSYGLWPRFLTAVMHRLAIEPPREHIDFTRYSRLSSAEQGEVLAAARDLTGHIYPGLDLSCEIEAAARPETGDAILLHEEDELEGFAVCHAGAVSEAVADTAFVKFAAVRPGAGAERRFERLLIALEAFAVERGRSRIEAGVNVARRGAYRQMLARGYATFVQGVAMQRPDEEGPNHGGAYVIDDWR